MILAEQMSLTEAFIPLVILGGCMFLCLWMMGGHDIFVAHLKLLHRQRVADRRARLAEARLKALASGVPEKDVDAILKDTKGGEL